MWHASIATCSWDWALISSQTANEMQRAGTGGHNIIAIDPLDSIDVPATLAINHSYVFEAGKVREDLSNLILIDAPPAPAPRKLVQVPIVALLCLWT
jgi:hypothetical protein